MYTYILCIEAQGGEEGPEGTEEGQEGTAKTQDIYIYT